LVIETTGLVPNCVKNVTHSKLPNLEHLSLWLGSEDRGAGHPDSLSELFSGNFFPKLKYLGLNNYDKTDIIAKMLLDAPLLDRLETVGFAAQEQKNCRRQKERKNERTAEGKKNERTAEGKKNERTAEGKETAEGWL